MDRVHANVSISYCKKIGSSGPEGSQPPVGKVAPLLHYPVPERACRKPPIPAEAPGRCFGRRMSDETEKPPHAQDASETAKRNSPAEQGDASSEARGEPEQETEQEKTKARRMWALLREEVFSGVTAEGAERRRERQRRRKLREMWLASMSAVAEQKRLLDLKHIAENHTVTAPNSDATAHLRAKQTLYDVYAPMKDEIKEATFYERASRAVHRIPSFLTRVVTGQLSFEMLTESRLKNSHLMRSESVHARPRGVFEGQLERSTLQVFSSGDVVLRQDRKVTWTGKTGSMRVLFNDLQDPLRIVLVPHNRLRRGVEIRCDSLAHKHRWIDALVLSVKLQTGTHSVLDRQQTIANFARKQSMDFERTSSADSRSISLSAMSQSSPYSSHRNFFLGSPSIADPLGPDVGSAVKSDAL